jgi:hypothetical protein
VKTQTILLVAGGAALLLVAVYYVAQSAASQQATQSASDLETAAQTEGSTFFSDVGALL